VEVFKGFIDKWTIISDDGEKEIDAIVFYYGLPITKYPKNELDPNLEYLEQATSRHAYYKGAMIWLLEYLENLNYNQFKLLLDLMTTKTGVPVKVKELENKDLSLYTGVFKGKLNDLYILIQEGKNIDITSLGGGLFGFSIFNPKNLLKILGVAIQRDPKIMLFILVGIIIIGLTIAGIIFLFKAFSIFNTQTTTNQGPFSIITINGTECIAMNGECVYYLNPAVP